MSITVFIPFLLLAIQYFLLNIFNLYGFFQPYLRTVIVAITGLVFLLTLPIVIKRSLKMVIAIYSVTLLIFFLTFILFPLNRPYLTSESFQIIGISLPAMLYAYSIRDDDMFCKCCTAVSNAVAFLMMLLGLMKLWGTFNGANYSMVLSSYLLLPCIVLLRELFNKYSREKMMAFVLIVLLIILKGSRGALLSIATFIFIMIFSSHTVLHFDKRKSRYKKFMLFIVMIVIIILNQYIFMGINLFAKAIKVNSRTALIMSGTVRPDEQKAETSLINSLFEDNVEDINGGDQEVSGLGETFNLPLEPADSLSGEGGLYLAGRGVLYRTIWTRIQENGFKPLGIMGDRVVLNGQVPHNIVLEFISHFGLIFGSLLLIIYAIGFLYAWVTADKQEFELLSMWAVLGLVPLILSGSYLKNMHFWILTGLLLRSYKRKLDLRKSLLQSSRI